MKKKFLSITGILVLLFALVGFWGYNRYFKPDPEIHQQLTKQFGTEFFTVDDKKTVKAGAGDEVKAPVDLKKKIDIPMVVFVREKVNEQEKGGPESIATSVNESNAPKRITQDEVNMKYRSQLNYLQGIALSRLDTLYSAAIQEYKQNSKSGTVSRSELVQKYYQAGTMLEASMDSQFYSTLNAMEAELSANNFSTDIVGVTKSEYEKAKSNKRSQLLAKVLK